jgi:hypothetical protein
MKKLVACFYFFVFLHSVCLQAQVAPAKRDTLPNFSVKNAGGGRIVIGWVNNYPIVKQISIQRSFDSLNNFRTILTVADPEAIQNGYLDAKAPNDHMFYRLYILKDGGDYAFSPVLKPSFDTIRTINNHTFVKDTFVVDGKMMVMRTDTVMSAGKPVVIRAQPVVIQLVQRDVIDAVPNPDYNKTRMEAFTPSLYVYTNRDGYVRVNLPDDEKTKKYSIKFFDADDNFLFELKDIKQRDFKLDKTNFYHAGWFHFELYEGGKLIEKHKFFLEKDF